ncbi:urease accessory protein UreD [Aureimonas sp. ME7]|uniref:urease accessory protein UreD n=1 Tax=Aureimonas sp. ME7 TaxID=2744252 RepID=UPI001FCEDF5A|nr:urease accessory protein UreD [Aureimonas sp. ME7]
MQRARGRASALVGPVRRGDAEPTAIRRLHQAGCLKLRFPRLPGGACEAVVINTSGGLTGGDHLDLALCVEPRGVLTVTTQACERIYRSRGDAADMNVSLVVGPGATLSYLPQETILFDGGRLSRSLDVEARADSRFLLVESVVLGRTAMGETVREGEIRDRWRVRRDGRLVFADHLRLAGALGERMTEGAVLDGAASWSTILHQGPGADELVPRLREILGDHGGASLVDGLLVARLVAADGYALRQRLMPALALLAQAPLPRVWSL